ncbi:MAG: RDD family protein [Acidobacteriota bacterium]
MNADFTGGLALVLSLSLLLAVLLLRQLGRLPRNTTLGDASARRDELKGIPLASFGRRAAAWLMDLALITVAALIVELVEAVVQGDDSIQLHFEPAHSVQDAVLLVLYFGLLTYWGHGRTPGKRFLKIRVVSLTHSHLSLWHSVERALGYAASALEAGFGFWQYFVHSDRQTVHDRIAETIVVDERR